MNDLPIRKNIRLQGYDYSAAGYYFITICVKDRHELLGQIVGDAAFGVPSVKISEIGNIVKTRIENINNNPNCRIDKYVIMPNHIHLIIIVHNSNDGTPKAASPTKTVIPQIINALKSLVTKQIGYSIWQRSFNDRIIRGEDDYRRIWQYINENPAKWAKDKYYK